MYLYPYNNNWISDYLIESKAILCVYGDELKLYHIGSTAVKGLYAKDCIDMLGVVDNLDSIQLKITSLTNLGYRYKGNYGINGREYFSKKVRKTHLHIFQEGDANIDKHLNFVSTLKDSPQLIDKLNTLKCHLHDQYPNDKNAYQNGKVHFYDEIHKLLGNK